MTALCSSQIPENFDIPIFYGHGGSDPLIPPAVAQASLSFLEGKGFSDLKFKMYPGMQHSTCGEEIQDIKQFLENCLPAEKMTAENLSSKSVKELKQFLMQNGVDSAQFLEKSELIEKAKSLL